MKVGTRTATAINHGPKRETEAGAWDALVMASLKWSTRSASGQIRAAFFAQVRSGWGYGTKHAAPLSPLYMRSMIIRMTVCRGSIRRSDRRLRQLHRRLQPLAGVRSRRLLAI